MCARTRTGRAWLVAAVESGATRLTRVAHRSPARLLPMRTAGADSVGAAACALGSYGGGLLGGDDVAVDVTVSRGATLALTTQASTKIYRTKPDGRPASQHLRAAVGPEALLVVAPDPIVPYARSAYVGQQTFDLAPGASLVAIDWF